MKKKFNKYFSNLANLAIGIFWIFFSVFILLSVISYNELDPSLNVSTNQIEIYNITGVIGSYISDFLIQFLGILAFMIPFIFFRIGKRQILNKTKYSFYYKIIMFFVFCFFGSTFFSAVIPSINYWGFETWGGAIGFYLVERLAGKVPLLIIIVISFVIMLTSFSILIDISRRWWKVKLTRTYFLTLKILKFIKLILSKVFGFIFTKVMSQNFKDNIYKIYDKLNFIKKIKEHFEKKDSPIVKPKKKKAPKKPIDIDEKEEENRPLTLCEFELPNMALLSDDLSSHRNSITKNDLLDQSRLLSDVLDDFGIQGEILGAKAGPIITLHEFEPSAGTKSSRVIGLSDDIARSMSSISARISVVPGKNVIGIEIPNKKREVIYLKTILESEKYNKVKFHLPIILGTDISGEPVIADLSKMPHLLVAGTTGSGKSVSINTMILSLLYRMKPEECKFIMIDPKMLELSVYNGIPHLLMPVVTESSKAILALRWVVREMEDRYRAMAGFGVRNITNYNEKITKSLATNKKIIKKVQVGFDIATGEPNYEKKEINGQVMPYIVVIVDEMADLMITAGKEIEASIQRLSQMARAAGIHIVMATQRPSVDVITGVIKANFPTRVSFQVTSKIDSRTVLGEQGAEQLLGMGDMLYMANGGRIKRVHGPFVSDEEIENVSYFLKSQGIKPTYIDVTDYNDGNIDCSSFSPSGSNSFLAGSSEEDQLYNSALQIVKDTKKTSISYIQRHLRIGYNKAANLVERMESEGILSKPGVNGRREIIDA